MSRTSRFTTLATITAATGAMLALGTGTAAADEWPEPGSWVYEITNAVTPTDLDFWNPSANKIRIVSPYGKSTRIVCFSFHGSTFDCWQGDADGNAHKLRMQELPILGPVFFYPS
ncbi:hypothetical protein ACQPXH_26670 [Nocardia sp. CA-135953]|uniref:hypothetical protein n=1 Tax=Nocardia sp. CA-135953 TaxID=3239978 RepID=UPI003D9814C8